MITRDPRFKLLDGYSLQIKGVRPQDAGDYICQIGSYNLRSLSRWKFNKNFNSIAGDQENRDLVHTVEILVPPTVKAHPETGHITARKGSTITLECKASGNPVPSISWVKKVGIALSCSYICRYLCAYDRYVYSIFSLCFSLSSAILKSDFILCTPLVYVNKKIFFFISHLLGNNTCVTTLSRRTNINTGTCGETKQRNI